MSDPIAAVSRARFSMRRRNARIVAVEPDERVAQSCAGLDARELIEARIEDTRARNRPLRHRPFLPHDRASGASRARPRRSLAHAEARRTAGARRAQHRAILDADDIVEEWFIDKHLYHFSARTLMRMIAVGRLRDHRSARCRRSRKPSCRRAQSLHGFPGGEPRSARSGRSRTPDCGLHRQSRAQSFGAHPCRRRDSRHGAQARRHVGRGPPVRHAGRARPLRHRRRCRS